MARLPFNASSARGGDDDDSSPRRREPSSRAISVGDACRLIRTALESALPPTMRVEGEVSGLSQRNHWYFNLKDSEGVLQCVAWATAAARFGFTPQEGELVVATGSVSHYAPQGRTQFYVTKLEPMGTGALALRFRALCDELRRLGYFDETHKRELPPIPRRIAVITSAGGAALRDVIDTAQRRWPAVALLVVDVRVQGDGAAEQVAEAIGLVDRHAARLGIDAILVTRGGGSIEDLWAFNERVVADAAFRCRLPLVAAIGHESDTTVIELVADVRAATPTQAVMLLVPDREDLRRQAAQLGSRLRLLLRRRVEVERRRLDGLRRNELLRRPQAILRRHREGLAMRSGELRRRTEARLRTERRRLDGCTHRLRVRSPQAALAALRRRAALDAQRLLTATRSRLALRRQRLDGATRALRAVDPQSIVARGYSITTLEDGTLLRSVRSAPSGQHIITRLADGQVRSTVTDGDVPPDQSSRRDRRGTGRRGSGREGPSMDLFADAE